jgi:HAD superfamily hydrolase (TIGR01509 family)
VGWDAVLFDCDGVLVDSEAISCEVLSEMLGDIGLPHTFEETVDRFVGRSMASCLRLIEEGLGEPVPAEFAGEFERRTFARFSRDLVPVGGVVEALDRIPWPQCVASSGDHGKLRTTLGATGLLARFEGRIFSATEVARGKPHPDLFLHAAASMGAVAGRCAVVEDSILGVRAGIAAGMTVFGYGGTVGIDRLAAAGAIPFDDMRLLPALLERHGGDSLGS